MTEELLYTSAPRGLKPGSSGFCTVVSTHGMSAPLAQTLESLSGYRHLYPPGDPQAGLNPIVFSHLRVSTGGKTCSILSRVADYGLDYSRRTNKLAHHVVIESRERPAAGPAWLLSQPGFMDVEWDGELRILTHGRPVPRGDALPTSCQTWQQITGDAGWAGVLAQSWLENPDRLAFLRVEPGMPVLALIQEALALIPPERRWEVTFNTCMTTLPQNATCQWRCVLNGSKEANEARRFARELQLNLCQPLGLAPSNSATEAARTGRLLDAFAASSADTAQEADPADDITLAPHQQASHRDSNAEPYRLPRKGPPASPHLPPPPPVPKNDSKKRRWLMAGAATAAVLLVMGGIYLGFRTTRQPSMAEEALSNRQPGEFLSSAEEQPNRQSEAPRVTDTTPGNREMLQDVLAQTENSPSISPSGMPLNALPGDSEETSHSVAAVSSTASPSPETSSTNREAPSVATSSPKSSQDQFVAKTLKLGRIKDGDFELDIPQDQMEGIVFGEMLQPELVDLSGPLPDWSFKPDEKRFTITDNGSGAKKVSFEINKNSLLVRGVRDSPNYLDIWEYGGLSLWKDGRRFAQCVFVENTPRNITVTKSQKGFSVEMPRDIPERLHVRPYRCTLEVKVAGQQKVLDFTWDDSAGATVLTGPQPFDSVKMGLVPEKQPPNRGLALRIMYSPEEYNRNDCNDPVSNFNKSQELEKGMLGGTDASQRLKMFIISQSNNHATVWERARMEPNNVETILREQANKYPADVQSISRDEIDTSRQEYFMILNRILPFYLKKRLHEDRKDFVGVVGSSRVKSLSYGYRIQLPAEGDQKKWEFIELGTYEGGN